MDPAIRSQKRFQTQQNSATGFQVKTRDIPDTATTENTPELPAGVENFTVYSTTNYTILTAIIVCISYIAYKRYLTKK